MSLGFRICSRDSKVAPDFVSLFREIPVANVSDNMARMYATGCGLKPMHNGRAMAGPAFTVKSRPGDNLMLHKAIDMAEPGDVIVVDGGGDLTNSLIGELMVAMAVHRKLEGIVLNGAIRDSDTIHSGSFPIYAAGVTHRGPYKDGPGEINITIAINGMVIEPGDLIIGDSDGVLCVPQSHVKEVYERAHAQHKTETELLSAIQSGNYDRSWVDTVLKQRGCDMGKTI